MYRIIRWTHRELLLATVFILPVATAQSVDPQNSAHVLTMTTRLVVLDVVVTDKEGNIVSGLTQQDFTVYEDKEQQKIRSFEAPEQHLLVPDFHIASTADLAKAPQAPVTLIVLDELNTEFMDMAFARHSLEKYLKSQPAVLAQPTTLLVAGNSKFRVLLDYTRDRKAILAAVEKHFPDLPNRLAMSGKSGPGALERLAMSLGSLEQIAQATSGHPGRKNVIWVGRGFPAVNTKESTDKEAAVMQNAVEHAIDTLRDARITLSMIDPTINAADIVDIETPEDLDAAEDSNGSDPFAGDLNFQLLAPATGGQIYFSRNDVDAEIGTSVRDGSQYYTLSYSPTNHDDLAQPYRRISVKLDRPGLKATTRNGYYIQSSQPAPPATQQDAQLLRKKLAFDLGSAANSNIIYTGLPATVSRAAGQRDAFIVHVDTHELTWRTAPDGSLQAEVTIAIASFGKQKKMLARTVRELTAHNSNQQAKDTSSSTTNFSISAEIPSDAERVRFVVRDAASGKMGTVDFDPVHRR